MRSKRERIGRSVLKAIGAHVPLEEVEHLPEGADHRTPEALLLQMEDYREARERDARHRSIIAGLPEDEALALVMAAGLFGWRVYRMSEVALCLGASEEQATATVERARSRVALKAVAVDRMVGT